MNNRGVELVNVAPYMREKTKLKELASKAVVPTSNAKRLITQMIDDKNGHKQQPKQPPPEGGISISEGSRKYKILKPTIHRWVKRLYIPILLPTKREKYIDEARLNALAKIYHQNSGKGKWTIRQQLQ